MMNIQKQTPSNKTNLKLIISRGGGLLQNLEIIANYATYLQFLNNISNFK